MVDALEADVREASAWLATALTGSGYKADFSVASLHELDRFVDDNTDESHDVTGLLAVDTGPRMWAIGAYTGEVLRRHFGDGHWASAEDATNPELSTSLTLGDGIVVWPMARALARMRRGRDESLHAYATIICG